MLQHHCHRQRQQELQWHDNDQEFERIDDRLGEIEVAGHACEILCAPDAVGLNPVGRKIEFVSLAPIVEGVE